MRNHLLKATLLTAILAVAACGSSTGDRGLSGAGIGAAGGAIGGALVGAPAAGAAIGGAVGAAIGAFTNEKDLNLGKPIWEK